MLLNVYAVLCRGIWLGAAALDFEAEMLQPSFVDGEQDMLFALETSM